MGSKELWVSRYLLQVSQKMTMQPQKQTNKQKNSCYFMLLEEVALGVIRDWGKGKNVNNRELHTWEWLLWRLKDEMSSVPPWLCIKERKTSVLWADEHIHRGETTEWHTDKPGGKSWKDRVMQWKTAFPDVRGGLTSQLGESQIAAVSQLIFMCCKHH